MKISPHFSPDGQVLQDFLSENPLALLITAADGAMISTPLPLIAHSWDEESGLPVFLGHFARANPQAAMVAQRSRSLAVFSGANLYVSPSWMRDRTQAPTWNYMLAEYTVDIEVHDSPAFADFAVETLTAAMEAGRTNAWDVRELGARKEGLRRAVMPFLARAVHQRVKFKMGQNERADVLEDILDAIPEDHAGARWMRRLNSFR